MSVFVVRNKNGSFLRAPGEWVCVEDFKGAHKFASEEEARIEANKYPMWREVVHVVWVVKWVSRTTDGLPYLQRKKPNASYAWTEKAINAWRFQSTAEALEAARPWHPRPRLKFFGQDKKLVRVVRLMRVVKP